ncbi:hypothetical protein EOL70_05020 [Leucothrix sargassi]|nr:hypothetical protein EOL70_05020 [Leucothrix sargassi]
MDELLIATEKLLLESHGFRTKPQMQRLLSYLIRHSVEKNESALQQKQIAIACLGRSDDFIPAQDPIVRIEAARLRKLLDAFYKTVQQYVPYRLSLPKGSYRIAFARTEERALSSGLGLLLICQVPEKASEKVLPIMLSIRRELAHRISHFNHVELSVEHLPKHQVAEKGAVHFLVEKQHDYVLRVEVLDDTKGGALISSVVIHRVSQEILWSNSSFICLDNQASQLELYYRCLVRNLMADSFGLLGQHWAQYSLNSGLELLPDHRCSWVKLISLIAKPSVERANDYLAFLVERLRKEPNDYIAYAGYLYLGLLDRMFGFDVITESWQKRQAKLWRIAGENPTYDTFTVLQGLFCLYNGDREGAKTYLQLVQRLNPYSTCWVFLYGSALFHMGEEAAGVAVIQKIKQDCVDAHMLPSYYFLPEFIYYLERNDEIKIHQLALKFGLGEGEWKKIKTLKSRPDLVKYLLACSVSY